MNSKGSGENIVFSRFRNALNRPIVRWTGILVGVGLFAIVAFKAWSGMRDVIVGGDAAIGWLVISVFVMVGGEAFVGVGFARAASVYGDGIRSTDGLRIHFITAPARVLPGMVGTAVGRVGVGARFGLDTKSLLAGSVIEPVASAVVAAGLGLAFLGNGSSGLGLDLNRRWFVLAVLGGVAAALVVIGLIWYARRELPAGIKDHPSSFVVVLGLYATAWMFFGAGLMTQIWALGAEPPSLGASSAVFAVSWLIGFTVILVPGGLGVREGVLALLLTPSLGEDLSAVVAVMARVVWWMATATIFLIGVIWARFAQESAQKS